MNSASEPSGVTELNELSRFITELLGWNQIVDSRTMEPTGWTRGDEFDYWMMPAAIPYAESIEWSWELVDWLNERGYLADFKQIPRGLGFLMDDMIRERSHPDYPALVTLEPVHQYMNREFRTMAQVALEQTNPDVPFDRYCYRPIFCCKTVPEALCKAVRALVEKYPELREPVVVAAPQPDTEPAV